MTREEAIAQLKMDRDLANFNPMTGEEEPMNEDCRKSVEALDMAIKALEQQYLNQTDQYNAGYNAAKREIALSGEYERAYERGKADAHPNINDGKLSEIPTGSEEDKE